MPKLAVCDMTGKKVGDVDLNEGVFQSEPNIPLMHQAVVAEDANKRQGTADTKDRGEVRGGGAKPYRQKGTGRARQGTIRAPHYTHGGVVFGPTPRSYAKKLNKKMRRAALKSALSARVADGDVVVVDEIKLDGISTKTMAAFLKSVEAAGKVLLVQDAASEAVTLSARNIPGVELRISPAISVRDVLNSDKIVITQAATRMLEEVFA